MVSEVVFFVFVELRHVVVLLIRLSMRFKVGCSSSCVLVVVARVEIVDMVVWVTVLLLVLHAFLLCHVAFTPVISVVISKNILVI